jgi:signal transduction histidine kinase/ABC-type sugar transport system substrate-binding protein
VSSARSPQVIGFSYPAVADRSHLAAVADAMHLRAASLGVTLADSPAASAEDQAGSIVRWLGQQVTAIVVAPIAAGDAALVSALARATAAGVRIVSLGARREAGSELGGLDAAELEAQAALARHVFAHVGGHGQVAWLADRDLPGDAPRRRGLGAALAAFPGIELISIAGGALDAAVIRDVLAHRPDLQAWLAASDELALQASAAIAAGGARSGPVVAGFGGSPEALRAIDQGTLFATVRIDANVVARRALDAALGQVDPGAATGACEVITRTNLQRVTVDLLAAAQQATRDLARRNQDHRQTAEFLAQVLDVIPLMLFVKDAKDLRYRVVNKAREEWLGIDRLDHLGKTARDVYPGPLAERFELSDRKVLNGTPDVDLPAEHPTWTTRGQRYVHTRKLALHGSDGRPAFLVGVSIDTTERKLAELALAERNRELEAAHATQEQQQQLLRDHAASAQLAATAADAMTQQLRAAQAQLVEASRRAGRSDVATTVLHNVGNVLNSVNVSAVVINDLVTRSKLASLSKIATLIAEHREDLGRFFRDDPRGQKLPAYFAQLPAVIARENAVALGEVKSLMRNIDHIKVIIRSQQSHVTTNLAAETFDVHGLLDDALKFSSASCEQDAIEIVRHYDPLPAVRLDRHKALQILTNLLANARDAVVTRPAGDRRIVIAARRGGPAELEIVIEDNGCGVDPSRLDAIFQLGFTTKADGRGLGLHYSACAARELQGQLTVRSAGVGRGAAFVLVLPCDASAAA